MGQMLNLLHNHLIKVGHWMGEREVGGGSADWAHVSSGRRGRGRREDWIAEGRLIHPLSTLKTHVDRPESPLSFED